MDNNAVVEALQAELRRITNDRDAKSSRMWELGKQCDALEEELAALKQSLAQPAQETEGQKFNRLLEQESAVEALHSDFLENFEYPDYNVQAMGHGLEDRGITDRYEAMAYGWQEAVDTLAEMIQDWFAAAPEVQPSQPSAPVVPEGEYLCPNCVTPWKCNGPHIPEPAQRDERAELLARAERAEGLIERIKDFAEIHNIYNLENEFSGSWDGLLQNVCPADLSKLTIRSKP